MEVADDEREGVPVRASRIASHPNLSAFAHRDFALFWTAALISNSAGNMQVLAVPFVLFELTDSNTWLGIAAFAQLGPMFVLTPFAGALADRFPRRLIIACTTTVMMVVSFTYLALFEAGDLSRWWILALQLVSGFAAGFQVAAWQSFIPTLVPRSSLLVAVRFNSIQFTASRALGPLAAAILLEASGISLAFLINGVTFLLVLAALAIVRPTQIISSEAGEPIGRVIREGIRFVRSRTALRLACVTGLAISFFGMSIQQFAASFAKDVFGFDGEAGPARLVLAYGIGAVTMSVALVTLGERVRRSTHIRQGFVRYVLGLALIVATTNPVIGLIGWFIVGTAHVAVAVATNTAIQIQVPDEVRGRVMSIYLSGVLAGAPLAALVFGLLADAVGIRVAYGGGTAVFALFALLTVATFDGLRAFDVNRSDEADQPPG